MKEKYLATVSRNGQIVLSGFLTFAETLAWDDGQGSFHMILEPAKKQPHKPRG